MKLFNNLKNLIGIKKNINPNVKPEDEFVLTEFKQSWEHYRHIENERNYGTYLYFFLLTAVLGGSLFGFSKNDSLFVLFLITLALTGVFIYGIVIADNNVKLRYETILHLHNINFCRAYFKQKDKELQKFLYLESNYMESYPNKKLNLEVRMSWCQINNTYKKIPESFKPSNYDPKTLGSRFIDITIIFNFLVLIIFQFTLIQFKVISTRIIEFFYKSKVLTNLFDIKFCSFGNNYYYNEMWFFLFSIVIFTIIGLLFLFPMLCRYDFRLKKNDIKLYNKIIESKNINNINK